MEIIEFKEFELRKEQIYINNFLLDERFFTSVDDWEQVIKGAYFDIDNRAVEFDNQEVAFLRNVKSEQQVSIVVTLGNQIASIRARPEFYFPFDGPTPILRFFILDIKVTYHNEDSDKVPDTLNHNNQITELLCSLGWLTPEQAEAARIEIQNLRNCIKELQNK